MCAHNMSHLLYKHIFAQYTLGHRIYSGMGDPRRLYLYTQLQPAAGLYHIMDAYLK